MSCHMIHYGCYILTLDSCHHVTMITWPNHHWISYHVTARIELNSTEWWRSTNHVIEIKNRIIDNYDKDLFNWTEAKDRKNIFGAAKSQTQYLAQPKNVFLRNRKNVKTVQNSEKKVLVENWIFDESKFWSSTKQDKNWPQTASRGHFFTKGQPQCRHSPGIALVFLAKITWPHFVPFHNPVENFCWPVMILNDLMWPKPPKYHAELKSSKH